MNKKLRKELLEAISRIGEKKVITGLEKFVMGKKVVIEGDWQTVFYWYVNFIETKGYDCNDRALMRWSVREFVTINGIYKNNPDKEKEYDEWCDRALEVLKKKKAAKQDLRS